MEVTNKMFTEEVDNVVINELVNHPNNDRRLLVAYLCDKNKNPLFIFGDYKVRNNYEKEQALDGWHSICSKFSQTPYMDNGNYLSLRIMETDDNGVQTNVLGYNRSLLRF